MDRTAETEAAEERESEEEDGDQPLHQTLDQQDLPIMHWEALSQRIAELEKQEVERRERSKSNGSVSIEREEEKIREPWRWKGEEKEEEKGRCHLSVCSSRIYNHKNLQLCFINNSDSDEDEGTCEKVSPGAVSNGYHPPGLKQEVKVALRTLRDKLWAEQREKEPLACSSGSLWKHVDRSELLTWSLQQLLSLRSSLSQDVQGLSSELVSHLLIRDQLTTKQDAMLLDVQDMT